MALDDLISDIEVLKKRIQSHGATLREDETRTRMALIDPLLQALGWDVSDPALVTPEYKVSGRWADYALLRPDGRPAATVEAKKLGEALASHRMQMLNYANASGVEYAGLTNGNHWELYKVFEPGRLEERQILDVSIADAPAYESALKLLLFWRPNLESGRPVSASQPIVFDARLATPKPTDVEQAPTPRPKSPDWVALSALSEHKLPTGAQRPAAIRFWDGSERRLGDWCEVLPLVVEKLYSEGLLTVDDVPIPQSGKTYIVNTQPKHPTGKQFYSGYNKAFIPLTYLSSFMRGVLAQSSHSSRKASAYSPPRTG